MKALLDRRFAIGPLLPEFLQKAPSGNDFATAPLGIHPETRAYVVNTDHGRGKGVHWVVRPHTACLTAQFYSPIKMTLQNCRFDTGLEHGITFLICPYI